MLCIVKRLLYLKGTWVRYISILLFFICLPLQAEIGLLEALSNKAKNIERLSGVFTQQRKITVLPLPLISTGEFSYHHQSGMVWNTLEPIQSEIHITPQGIQTENDEFTTQTAGSAQLAKMLLGIFSGDLTSLSEQFDIQINGDITQWHLHLTPKNEMVAAQISSIDIRGKETTESVAIADANGDHTDLTFTTQQLVLFEN